MVMDRQRACVLTHWERARLQIAADRRDLRTRARIEMDEARWREAQIQDRAGLLLPPGRRLAEGEELLARRRAELDPTFVDFIGGLDKSSARGRSTEHAIAASNRSRRWGGCMPGGSCRVCLARARASHSSKRNCWRNPAAGAGYQRHLDKAPAQPSVERLCGLSEQGSTGRDADYNRWAPTAVADDRGASIARARDGHPHGCVFARPALAGHR